MSKEGLELLRATRELSASARRMVQAVSAMLEKHEGNRQRARATHRGPKVVALPKETV